MKHFKFTVIINGHGENADEAWIDACAELGLEPGPTPDNSKIETTEID